MGGYYENYWKINRRCKCDSEKNVRIPVFTPHTPYKRGREFVDDTFPSFEVV